MAPSRFLLSTALALGSASVCSAQFVLTDDLFNRGMDDAAITPDGRYAIVRENSQITNAHVYDMDTGALLHTFPTFWGGFSGPAQDAVVCNDERAVVMGSALIILDLNNLAAGPIASHEIGYRPLDLELTPDGSLVVVRGGSTDPSSGGVGSTTGGQFIFELATGSQVGYAPGEPGDYFDTSYTFDVDSVAVSDDHAVLTSFVDTPVGERTRVTLWDLKPAGGGPPQVVFETSGISDQPGAPHDVAMTPDGQYAAVRSELAIALYKLDGAQSTQAWSKRLFGDPGPFGLSAMDSVEVTNDRIATISRWSNGGVGAQVDVFDIAGNQKYDRIGGDPHDLTITPDAERLIVRTHTSVYLYDLANLPGGMNLSSLSTAPLNGSHTSFGAGLDSLVTTNDCAVALSRQNSVTRIQFFDLAGDTLAPVNSYIMPDMPIDVALTPDETKVAVSGLTHVMVFDLYTTALLLEHDPIDGGAWPWCDGLALSNDAMVAFGYSDVLGGFAFDGWLSVIDLFEQPQLYCSANANSTGSMGQIDATGSARIGANDLTLWATRLPANEFGFFSYADGTQATVFGDGFQCLGGQVFRLPITTTGPDGNALQAIDYSTLPAGGPILAGSQWNFQFIHRDRNSPGGTGFNLTAGLTIDFVN